MDDGGVAIRYHDATKHSELSLRTSPHYLDWENKPSPFKVYENPPTIKLPRDLPSPKEETLDAIKGQAKPQRGTFEDLRNLAEVLFFSAGLTRKMKMGSEFYYMRAASATGALYPIELYVLSTGFAGLVDGVYHFNPLEFALDRIREGDYGSELALATDDATASSPLTIAFTSLAWRNAWKYEARSYRHWFWDAGVIAANLMATCHSEGLPARMFMGFIDTSIDRLLGLEPEKEATVALATIGRDTEKRVALPHGEDLQRLHLNIHGNSREETEYPIIWETNRASSLISRPEVHDWRHDLSHPALRAGAHNSNFRLRPSKSADSSLDKVILRRGSTRRFAQKPISFDALSNIIAASTGPIPVDFLREGDSLTEFYMIVNDVEDLPAGSYHHHNGTGSLEQLKEGKLRYVSGYLCLEQLLFSDASVVFFLMTDLNRILTELGSRGYRAAQFEAGIRAGKIYLSAYAQGIGASGSTFYDDAVTEFLSPHAEGLSTMIAVGVGVPAYKARPGKILPQFSSH